MSSLFNSLQNLSFINYFRHNDSIGFSLSDLSNPTKYTKLFFYGRTGIQSTNTLTNVFLEGIGNFTNLTDLRIYNNTGITEFPAEISRLTNVKTIIAWNTSITNLEAIKNFSSLSYLNLKNSSLFESGFYTTVDGTTETCNNMEILKKLNQKSLRKLFLSGTNITDFSLISGLTWTEKDGF